MNTVVVDPVTRIEGHLRIEAETENGIITRASSSGTMLRGIENVLTGRDPRDAWAIAQRICGVCTLVHGIASVRAVENALDYPIPANAELIRNLMIGAQFVHDHVMHFYHLHALDWVDVVSALSADPAKAAHLQQCMSDWPNSTTDYFADVQQRLSAFVGSGQLGIFANGYWGHPEYKLPPELNLIAFAHYLEALDWQRRVARLHTIFGGKNPHPNFVVGGAPCRLDSRAGRTGVDRMGRKQVKEVILEMREFVDKVYVPDTIAIARFYKDWANRGEGVGNFMTYGDFPDAFTGANDDSRLFIPRGVILNRDLSTVHPVDLDDPNQVQEYVSHSWYDYQSGKDTPLHPYDGETKPSYSGPTPPYQNLDVDNSYSWLKSPRWKGKPMEVGPLARVLMLYASGNAAAQNLVNGTLAELKLPITALFSTLGRVAARTLETKLIADQMLKLVQADGAEPARRRQAHPQRQPVLPGQLAIQRVRRGLHRGATRRAGALGRHQRRAHHQLPGGRTQHLERGTPRRGGPGRAVRGSSARPSTARPGAAAGDPANHTQLRSLSRLRRPRRGPGRGRVDPGEGHVRTPRPFSP